MSIHSDRVRADLDRKRLRNAPRFESKIAKSTSILTGRGFTVHHDSSVRLLCPCQCFLELSLSLEVCSLVLCLCLFVCLWVCLFVCFFVCGFVCLFVCLLVCLFACFLSCSSVWLFVRLFVCSFVCLCVRLLVYLFVCLFVSVCVCQCVYVCVVRRVRVRVLLSCQVLRSSRSASSRSMASDGLWPQRARTIVCETRGTFIAHAVSVVCVRQFASASRSPSYAPSQSNERSKIPWYGLWCDACDMSHVQ